MDEEFLSTGVDVPFAEFVAIDNDVPTCEPQSVAEIAAEGVADEVPEDGGPPATFALALAGLEALQSFFRMKDNENADKGLQCVQKELFLSKGVLWTDDAFQAVRASIEKHFLEWLQSCHEHSDKQIMFESFQETISRRDTQKYKQYPWAVFNAIEWDGKRFKKGQLIRTQRTNPIIIGSIRRFLLYGDYTESVCATGGEVEIQQEPRSLYDEVKIFPLAKLDRKVTDSMLQKIIEEEEGRLPSKLYVTWPEGDQLYPNEKRPAGKAIGDIKVEIQNKKGENVSKLPGAQNKRLSVEMKIVWHSASGDKAVAQYVSPHNKNWGYWFRRMAPEE
ncbi:hypothetical protein HPB49_007560 [Dermacentor silvarum]|uniref:Uncharacterized protein n=1 Tax=Dermacentor silvarum TaxID=543639 RepID=A0ACB8C7Y7_DERSI|nr:hypothetical protein HPB49_007560 [Dermacentor silvarum]